MPRTAEQLDNVISQHSIDIAVLKSTNQFIGEDIREIKDGINMISGKVDKVATAIEDHKADNAREARELARETSGLQTKYSVLWYIIGTLVVGTMVGKFILPLLGL